MIDLSAHPAQKRLIPFVGAAVLLTLLVLIGESWNVYRDVRLASDQTTNILQMQTLRGRILQLDEVLTMSARMAGATGDPKWEVRYRGFEPQLDGAIKDALGLAPSFAFNQAAARTDAANIALVAIENRAFSLVRQGQLATAQALLSGTEYEAHKKVYAAGMAEFDSLLAGSIALTQRLQRQALRWDVVMVALATFGLGIGWWYVLLIARRWQVGLERGNAQLKRQGALLQEVNLDLDQKVAQRTVELSAKNVILSAQQENSPDAILVVDENARIASYNRKFVTLFSIPEDLVRASEDDEPVLMHVVSQMRDPDAFLAKVHYLYEHKEEGSRDEIHTNDGKIIDRFSSGMMGANGEYYGRVWYFHNITERKQAESALAAATAKLQAVMDAAIQISIVATDSQGLITVFNSGAERMLGYSAKEMIGNQTPLIMHLESEVTERGQELTEQLGRPIAGFDVIVEFARRGKGRESEWTYVCKNDSHLTVSLAVTALRDADGVPGGFLGVAKDITERKRTDAELLRFATELDQRIFAAAAANDALQRETEEMRRLNEERAALGNMNELLLACASAEEAFDIFGRAAAGLFESSTGALHIYAASRNQLTPAATWGEWPGEVMPFNPESCWGLRRGNYYLGSGTSTPPCEHAGPVQGGATLCVPLIAYGEVLGVLHLRGPDAAMLRSRLQLVTMANDGLALTLANIRLRQSLKEQSIRDPLTNLFNRRYLTETLEREFARAQRTGAPVAIVMIDMDHFKRFNDSFGHDAGDAVLQELGSFLRHSVRVDDIACRYGGEEFCLVLPQMDYYGAQQRAEAIRAGAAALEVKLDGRVLGPVTLSLGVAFFPEDGGDTESLVRAADEALYEAKKAGRNRVVMTSAAPVSQRAKTSDQKEQAI